MIICIGREFGSGGHEIGKRLSECLNIPFYDRILIDSAVERSGITLETLEKTDERKSNPWMHNVFYEAKESELRGLSASNLLFQIQKDMIIELAKNGDCVLVGRCADDILSKAGIERLSLFISAPFTDRIKRKMEITELDEKTVTALVRKMDKRRKAYYDYYTGRSWGKPNNYDICINSSVFGLDHTVHTLEALVLKLRKIK